MPLSNDNQDYGKSDEKNQEQSKESAENKLTTDDLKGKKIDADLEQEKDMPGKQEK